MVKNIVLFLFLFCLIQKGFGQEVKTYEEALILSKETNKDILLYFGADWCKYCKKMEETFKEKEVSEKIKDFIVLKLNRDNNKELAKEYNVKTIPDYMIIDKDKNVLKRHTGYKDKKEFINWLK